MIPNWASELEDVDEVAVRSQMETLNIPSERATGESSHIGIIDSAWNLGDQSEGTNVIESQDNAFIDPQSHLTTNHAREVFHRIAWVCPDATITLYQAVNEDRTLPLTAYRDAVNAAIDDDVDILNISAGDPWRGPVRSNPNVPITKDAIEEGITVVAAAGNFVSEEDEERPPVHCPAAISEVIAVGGMQVLCPASIGDESEDEVAGPYYSVRDDELSEEEVRTATRCSYEGCVDGQSCLTNQKEVEWDGNPLPTNDKPDVLSPMYAPQQNGNDSEFFFKNGTSFAAPYITGSLGCIFDAIRQEGDEIPDPMTVRKAVRSGNGFPRNSNLTKYDAIRTRKSLGIL